MADHLETLDLISSYVALGDSFTEGLNDPRPDGGFAGWADRLAALLADRRPEGEFRYANLAVRGRLLDQVVTEQVPQVRRIQPDLVTFCAGGNDILRPGSDPDEVAERFEQAVVQLRESAGTVLICTGFDTRGVPVLKHLRGKIATYNVHLRAIADRNDCAVADLWSLRPLQGRPAWSEDRLHLSPRGTSGSRCSPPAHWGCPPRRTRPRRGPPSTSTPPPNSAGRTCSGRRSTCCPGWADGCAASPRATTWRPSGPTCCRSDHRKRTRHTARMPCGGGVRARPWDGHGQRRAGRPGGC